MFRKSKISEKESIFYPRVQLIVWKTPIKRARSASIMEQSKRIFKLLSRWHNLNLWNFDLSIFSDQKLNLRNQFLKVFKLVCIKFKCFELH